MPLLLDLQVCCKKPQTRGPSGLERWNGKKKKQNKKHVQCSLKPVVKVEWCFLCCFSKISFREKTCPALALCIISYYLPPLMPTSVSLLKTKLNAAWNQCWANVWMRHAVHPDGLLIYLCQSWLVLAQHTMIQYLSWQLGNSQGSSRVPAVLLKSWRAGDNWQ